MKTFLFLGAVLVIIVSGGLQSYAFDIEPYVKAGTIDLVEGGIEEGHKLLLATRARISTGEKVHGTLSVEGWWMGEPYDEDREMPNNGFSFSGEVAYRLIESDISLFPFVSVAYEGFHRDKNIKYDESWSRIEYITGTVGVKATYRVFYLKFGALFPFAAETDRDQRLDTEIGFDFETGILWKNITLGYFLKKTKFESGDGQPGLELNLYGGMVAYRIAL